MSRTPGAKNYTERELRIQQELLEKKAELAKIKAEKKALAERLRAVRSGGDSKRS